MSLNITATFWDCGGVLLTNGWDHSARCKVAEHFGLNFAEFEQRHDQLNDPWERGKITLHQYLEGTVFYVPRKFSEEDFIAKMRAISQILYPEMIAFVRRLRVTRTSQAILGIYLLSNESRELMSYRIPQFGLTDMFDAFLVSAYIGLRKPDEDFFQCALNIAQRPPEQCVFIDDREENIAAARNLGIHGVRLEIPQQAIADLSALGINAS
jgi:putative hydrolase of the HAD superfamily